MPPTTGVDVYLWEIDKEIYKLTSIKATEQRPRAVSIGGVANEKHKDPPGCHRTRRLMEDPIGSVRDVPWPRWATCHPSACQACGNMSRCYLRQGFQEWQLMLRWVL